MFMHSTEGDKKLKVIYSSKLYNKIPLILVVCFLVYSEAIASGLLPVINSLNTPQFSTDCNIIQNSYLWGLSRIILLQ